MIDDANDDGELLLLPWVTAAIGAAGALAFYLLVHDSGALDVGRHVAATFVGVSVASGLITLDRHQWRKTLGFALFWGAVVAFVGYFTASYNRAGSLFEWPFLSGLAAVAVAAPLFQAARETDIRHISPARVHHHVWTDATMAGVALLFTGLTFFTAWMIAVLFGVIGIDAIKDLLEQGGFVSSLAGFAFGGAVGLLRVRERLTGTVRKLAMVVLVLIAPVLAFALWSFLVLLPVTGLQNFWHSGVPATPVLLLGAFGAFSLANIIIGDGEGQDGARSPLLRLSGLALIAAILPLALLAALSMGQRIGQYGWTPERLWGVIAIAIAAGEGAIGWWSLFKGRRDVGDWLRPLQVRLAQGVVILALLLALPLLDFGRISASSQLARLQAGRVSAAEFDWKAMAFDFGPAGRRALERIKAGGGEQARLAGEALAATNRYDAQDLSAELASRAQIRERVRLRSPGIVWSDDLVRRVEDAGGCFGPDMKCALVRLDDTRLLLVRNNVPGQVDTNIVDLKRPLPELGAARPVDVEPRRFSDGDPTTGAMEIRKVERRQLFIDGKPVGELFE